MSNSLTFGRKALPSTQTDGLQQDEAIFCRGHANHRTSISLHDVDMGRHHDKDKRRRRKARGKQPRHETDYLRYNKPNSLIVPIDSSARSPLWNFTAHLPQPMDDKSINNIVQRIFTLAHQYISNFYEDRPVQNVKLKPTVRQEVFSCCRGSDTFNDLLNAGVLPTTVMKHSLVVILLEAISLESKGDRPSLLPREFLAMARAIRQSTASDIETPQSYGEFAAYRLLCYRLRKSIREDTMFVKNRDRNIDEIAEDIEATFDPWVRTDKATDRRGRNLIGLLQETAEVGLLLFSQAACYVFEWKANEPSNSKVEVVISPRMLKVYDHDARRIHPAQQMINVRTEMNHIMSNRHQRMTVSQQEGSKVAAIVQNHRLDINKNHMPLPVQDTLQMEVSSKVSHEILQAYRRGSDAEFTCDARHELPGDVTQASVSTTSALDYYAEASQQLSCEDFNQDSQGQEMNRFSFDATERPKIEPQNYHEATNDGLSNSHERPGVVNILGVSMQAPTRFRSLKQPGINELDASSGPSRHQNLGRSCPPTSFPDSAQNQIINRRNSGSRGRLVLQSERPRERSMSESGAISRTSWTPDSTDGRDREEAVALTYPNGSFDSYLERRSALQRSREHRDAPSSTPQPWLSEAMTPSVTLNYDKQFQPVHITEEASAKTACETEERIQVEGRLTTECVTAATEEPAPVQNYTYPRKPLPEEASQHLTKMSERNLRDKRSASRGGRTITTIKKLFRGKEINTFITG